MKRLRDPFDELGHSMPFERAIVAQPTRSHPVTEKVQRKSYDSRKSGLVDSRIEVRVNAGLRHSEWVVPTKDNLRDPGLHLVFCHSHSKPKQFRNIRKLRQLQG